MGNFVVAWTSGSQDGHSYGVYAQVFNGNSTKFGSEFQVNSYTTNSQRYPSVASFSNGNFVVTWHSELQDGSGEGVYGQLFYGNGTKIGSEFRVNTYTANFQHLPSVATFNNGNFVVTWGSNGQDGSSDGVFGQLFYGNDSKIGNEFQINTYTNSGQNKPSVANLSNGNFVVTWESHGQDGSGDGVYSQLFDGTGTKIGSEFRINTYTTNEQVKPSVASFTNGNFVVAWNSEGQDGSGVGVYGQLFNGNGSKIGIEFRANNFTTSYQVNPSVASLADGNFVVTWDSDGQDGSSYGIYGQIFNDFPMSSTTRTTTSSTTSSISSSTTNTSTTSSTTPSVSTSTTFAIRRTKTSVNPSNGITVPSTTSPRTTRNRRATLPTTSDPSNRFSWIWFLLGGVGAIFCLGLTVYLIFKSRKKDGNVHAFDL